MRSWTKQLAALALACSALLCGCEKITLEDPPSRPRQQASGEPSSETPLPAPSGTAPFRYDYAPFPLGNLQEAYYAGFAPGHGGVYDIQHMAQDYGRLLFTDLGTAAQRVLCSLPGCAHTNETCHAWVEAHCSIIPANGTLNLVYWGYAPPGEEEVSYIVQMNTDGSGRRVLCTLPAGQSFTGSMYTDGNTLLTGLATNTYTAGQVPGQQVLDESLFELVAVDLASGSVTPLLEWQGYPIAAWEDKLLILYSRDGWIYERLVAFSPGSGEVQTLLEGPFGWDAVSAFSLLHEDALYGVLGDPSAEGMCLVRTPLATGETSTIFELAPGYSFNLQFAAEGRLFFKVDDFSDFSTRDAMIDISGNQPLSPAEESVPPLILTLMGHTGPVGIVQKNDTHYLVATGMINDRFSYTDPSGITSYQLSSRQTYSLITPEDYWAGTAQFVPVAMIH